MATRKHPNLAVRFIRSVSDSMLLVGVILICVISLCSMYGVGMRFLGRPVTWVLELTELLQVALAFLPAAYVLNANKHVSVEVADLLLGASARRVLRGAVTAMGAIVCGLLTYSTATVALSSVAMGEATVNSALPIYPFKICVVVGYALLTLQFAAHTVECWTDSGERTASRSPQDSYI